MTNPQMKRSGRLLLAACVALAAPAAPGAAQSSGAPVIRAAPTVLHAGDILRIQIWRENDLSGDFLVDERGLAILPLLGPQEIAGHDIESLRRRLQGLYERHIENPSVTITPLKRIHVLGEVTTPGVLFVDPTVTVTGAVALAGGSTLLAARDRIRITRASGEIEEIRMSEGIRLPEIRSGDEIRIPPRSWLSRNTPLVLSMVLGTLTTVAVSLLVSGS